MPQFEPKMVATTPNTTPRHVESSDATGQTPGQTPEHTPGHALGSTAGIPTHPRCVLPPTRRSLTHKFCVGGHEGYLTIGLFDDGQPGEIFIKMSKEGSTLSGLLQGFCLSFSYALQFGWPLPDAVDRFRGMRFEPLGPTNNPEIPEATSILDYVARYLAFRFLKEAEMPK